MLREPRTSGTRRLMISVQRSSNTSGCVAVSRSRSPPVRLLSSQRCWSKRASLAGGRNASWPRPSGWPNSRSNATKPTTIARPVWPDCATSLMHSAFESSHAANSAPRRRRTVVGMTEHGDGIVATRPSGTVTFLSPISRNYSVHWSARLKASADCALMGSSDQSFRACAAYE